MPEPQDAHEEGKPLSHLLRHDLVKTRSVKTRLTKPPPKTSTKTSKSNVNQQPITGLSQGQRGPLRSREQCACFCLTPPSQDHQTSTGKVTLIGLSLDVHFRRGYLPLCHQHSAFFSDRVRGARTYRLLCNTSASD